MSYMHGDLSPERCRTLYVNAYESAYQAIVENIETPWAVKSALRHGHERVSTKDPPKPLGTRSAVGPEGRSEQPLSPPDACPTVCRKALP
jgi:hypothetical protein